MTRLAKVAVLLVLSAGFVSFPLLAQDKAAVAAWKNATDQAKQAISKNEFTQANECYEAALVEAQKFPTNDARLSDTLTELAYIRRQLGDGTGAELAVRRALVMDQNRLGTNDYHLLDELLFLGDLCSEAKRYEEADSYCLRAEEIAKWKFGKYDRIVGVCLQHLGRNAARDGRLEEAEKLFQQALGMIDSNRYKVNFALNQFATRSVARPSKTELAGMHDDIGALYQKEKKFTDAENEYKTSLSLLEDQFGKNDQILCNVLRNLALLYIQQNKLAEAESVLLRSLAILKNTDPHHPMVINTHRLLDAVFALKLKATPSPPPPK